MKPLWSPSPARAAASNLAAFMARAGSTGSYEALHRWSIDDREGFWNLVWDFCGVQGTKGARTLVDGDRMPGARFFPDGQLNFAQNLLRARGDEDAIVFWGEDKIRRRLSRTDLHDLVSRLQQALAAAGVKKGDRVAGYLRCVDPEVFGPRAFHICALRAYVTLLARRMHEEGIDQEDKEGVARTNREVEKITGHLQRGCSHPRVATDPA